MKTNVYKGKLGHEQLLYCLGDIKDYLIPHKKELICLGNRAKVEDEVYKVINVLYDYSYGDYSYSDDSFPEVNIFVEEYNWED